MATSLAIWHSRRRLVFGLTLLALIGLLAIFADFFGRKDPYAIDPPRQYRSPSFSAPMGTDNVGMDVFSRTLHATRVDLPLAVGGIGLALVVGVSLGVLAAVAGGFLDAAIGRVADGFQAFPPLLLALLAASLMGPGFQNLLLIIALLWTPVFLRTTRTQILILKHQPYIEIARILRHSWPRIAVAHLLPNAAPALLAQAALSVGYCIILAAGLGFLGLGPPPPTPEWGAMIGAGMEGMAAGRWWLSVFPGALLVLTVGAFALIADGVQEGMDPRLT